MTRPWIPVPGTTTGRLVEAALELFGAHGLDAVAVSTIAQRAGVTTGSLYHHFGSKAGLYMLVRADVEQRVVDRLEGAASMRPVRTVADLAPVVLVAFDYLMNSGLARLLAEPPPDVPGGATGPDRIAQTISAMTGESTSAHAELVVAAWRTAVLRACVHPARALEHRVALNQLLSGTLPRDASRSGEWDPSQTAS